MKKIWICPKCRSTSTRRGNLNAHLKNCHPDESLEPIAYDPLLKEYYVTGPEKFNYYSDSSWGKQAREVSSSEEEGKIPWLRKQTRMLNELSDYGDAVLRFKNHAPTPTFPLIQGIWSNTLGPESPIDTFRPTVPDTDLLDYFSSRKTLILLGDVCIKCGKIIVVPSGFPPCKTARECHDDDCGFRTHNSTHQPMSFNLQNKLLDQLVKKLKEGIQETFEGKTYLYCSELISGAFFLKVIKNREEIEDKIGFLKIVRHIKMQTVTEGESWIVRACALGRTELSELEMDRYLSTTKSTCALFWAPLDCSPAHYLIWIDEEKPRLEKWVDKIRMEIFTRGLY